MTLAVGLTCVQNVNFCNFSSYKSKLDWQTVRGLSGHPVWICTLWSII